ncbi:MAG: HAD-IIA family hydrolase [Alphaproteobacteria bacterium]
MTAPLRLAVVTDIHHGPAKMTKKGDAAIGLLGEFVAHANRATPDFAVDLGDRISDIDAETDRRLESEVAAVFADVQVPRLHMLGNHDLVHLDRDANADVLGVDTHHRVVEAGEIRLLLWQADVNIDWHSGLLARDADLDWLRETLASDDRPTVILSHVPLDNASMEGNYYFQNNPQFAGYRNGHAIRRVLRESGNVIACIAGHTHWNRLSTLDGIPFITVQSLTESFTTEGEASAAFAEFEIDESIRWRTVGNDPIDMTLPRRGHNHRWIKPLPPFADLLRTRGQDLSGVRGLILDLDGVVYRGNEPVPGAADFLRAQRAAGRRLLALTNNAQNDAEHYAAKLAAMGIEFPAADILTAGEATAHLLVREGCPTVQAIGSPALHRALAAHGIGESDMPEIVVVGMTGEATMAELMTAVGHLGRGARLLATNPDTRLPVEGGGVTAECGALIAFLESASGRTAEVVGKPNKFIYELALQRLGLPARDVLMVGDTPETDIAGAVNAGLRSALVATGNADDDRIVPTVRVAGLSELGSLLVW